jgi:oligopeptidase B
MHLRRPRTPWLAFLLFLCGRAIAAQTTTTAPPAPASSAPAVAITTTATVEALKPPVAPRVPHETKIHGDTIADDYYWLRNKGTPEVESYLNAELAYAKARMKPTEALQQKLYDEMLSRVQQTDVEVPYLERGYYYYSRTEEGKQYPIYCRKKGSLSAPEEVILDVNQLATGKQFMSVAARRVSPDGNLLAFTSDETGFRQYKLSVKDLRTGKLGPEAVERVTSVEWAEDGSTLLYSVEHPQTKRSYQVFRHKLGDTSPDPLVYEEKDERFDVGVDKSRDHQVLFVVSASHTTAETRFLPADHPLGELVLVAPRIQGQEYYVDHRPGELWITTNDTGRNFRVVKTAEKTPGREHWKEVVAQRDDVMVEGLDMFRDFYVLVEREGGIPHLRVTDVATGDAHRVEFAEAAYAVSPSVNREFDAQAYRLSYQSPVTAPSTYDYDRKTRKLTLLKQVPVPNYDPSRYRVELTSATASDGVKVPIWMVMRKDVKPDGTHPALLYGYGSYGVAMTAGFSSSRFSLLDRGMVYAMAYPRGGGELGKKWHDAGRMMNKRNTFTDFIAAGEHLKATGWAKKDGLAILGGSAGGLLVGAATNMRPDLFDVVIAAVPFVDVINTMLDETLPLTVGEFEEWGNPKIEDQYRYIKTYSPYDNVEAKAYPTMLVESSYNDSQVFYHEPAKWVAKLRAKKTDDHPLLFRINMDPAGHGGKSGRYDRLRETAFEYAFLLWQLGVEQVGTTTH